MANPIRTSVQASQGQQRPSVHSNTSLEEQGNCHPLMPLEDAFLECSKDNFKTKEYPKRGAMGQGRVKGENFNTHI